jgi:transposase, IS5 family
MASATRESAMKRNVREQYTLAEALVGRKLGVNDTLDRIGGLLKWYRFEKVLARLHGAPTGRPAYAPLTMFKALLLAQWYGLSDQALEEAMNDRLSFRRFAGFGLDERTPDHTTFCRFRNDLAEQGLTDNLFEEVNRQMERLGLILKRGTLIDATLVEAATRPPAFGSDEEPLDGDAGFSKRAGRSGSIYGFKAHVGVDQGSNLIRMGLLTAANVNETVVADDLIQGDEGAVYADAAYDTHERRAALRAREIKDRIMHRPNKHHPQLSRGQRRRNRAISSIRARVETIFAILKRHYGYVRVRYRGLIKNQSQLLLLCIALNLRRAAVLTCS